MGNDEATRGTRKPRPDLQERLVEATLDLLLEVTPADLVAVLGTRAIADRAGVSQATVFHQFGSVAGLAEALVARDFAPGALPVEAITAGVQAVKDAGLPVQAGNLYHRSEFARLTGDRELRARMGLWALGAGQTDQAYAEFLRVTDAAIASFAEQVWEHWGREVRPPFDTGTYVAAQVALLNGLSIRHLVDPELSTADNYALAASVLTLVMLRATGDTHDLADKFAEINYYPLRNTRTGRPLSERGETGRAALMVAAADLFGSRGYEETTVAQIARRAGVSASTVYRAFGSKAGLATALFRKQAEDMLVFEPEDPGSAGQRWEAHLVAVARFAGEHTEHAPAYLSALLTSRAGGEDDLLVATTRARLLEVASPTLADPVEVATGVLSLLIGRVLARPADSWEEQVRAVTAAMGLPPGSVIS